MVKKRRRSRANSSLDNIGFALDFLLQGQSDVFYGPDFIMGRNIFGSLQRNLEIRKSYPVDHKFVTSLAELKAINQILIPKDLENLQKEYKQQRTMLGNYQEKAQPLIFKHEINAATELGNLDQYNNKPIIGNNAELNVFYDYITLYTKIDDIRFIKYWAQKNQRFINKNNKAVASALMDARFAVLRIDQNLSHGAIIVTDVITKTSYVLIDLALNRSRKEGCFNVCSILNMGSYIMTSGTGIILAPELDLCRSLLTLLKKYLPLLRRAKTTINSNIIKCVKEIFGFALNNDLLEHVTSNTEFYT